MKLLCQMSAKAEQIGNMAVASVPTVAGGWSFGVDGTHLQVDAFAERVRVVEAVGAAVRVRFAPGRGPSQSFKIVATAMITETFIGNNGIANNSYISSRNRHCSRSREVAIVVANASRVTRSFLGHLNPDNARRVFLHTCRRTAACRLLDRVGICRRSRGRHRRQQLLT